MLDMVGVNGRASDRVGRVLSRRVPELFVASD